MLKNIISWMQLYNVEISWFVIGFLASTGLFSLVLGNYLDTLFILVLMTVNFLVYRRT